MSDANATASDRELIARLDAVMNEAGIFVAAEIRDGVLTLAGEVDSVANRDAALDVATALAAPQGIRVNDGMDVLDAVPDTGFLADAGAGGGLFAFVDPDVNHDGRPDPGFELVADFTDAIGTTDSAEAAAEAIPYFPPTDPVVRPIAGDAQLEVVGGFGATALDDRAGQTGFDVRNDDDITQSLRRELTEDALTTDLDVLVTTRDGVVILRGMVPSLEDAENVEAVAAGVGGVVEVREELTIEGLIQE